MDDIFSTYKSDTIKTHDWYAYPEYTIPQTFLPFVLEESTETAFLYGNCIEQVAGAMEMSAIAGRNLANICWDWLKQNRCGK